ncbi:MAG: YaiO family outer membrane beta-barrel protein [Marinifilaceae bacterium]|jgi:YaiO family outer membrane protein|nr:YaiO family outer membrane beta-barrel protein [Marinifilaceae bacterium]
MRRITLLFILIILYSESSSQNTKFIKSIGINHTIEFINKPIDFTWNLASIYSEIDILKFNNKSIYIIPEVKLAERVLEGNNLYENPGFQWKIDSYIPINKKINIYVSYAYSQDAIFPQQNIIIQANQNIYKTWGLIYGVKYVYWKKTIMNYIIGVEKYLGNMWITLKPSIMRYESKNYLAVNIGNRIYFKGNKYKYVHIGYIYGHSAETIYHADSEQLLKNKTWGVYCSLNYEIFKNLQIQTSITFRNEELSNDINRDIPGLNLGMKYRF